LYKVAEGEKRDAVSFIIRERGLKQVIVFSNTKIGASRLAVHLVKQGVKASAIHGDKSQAERMAALEAFKRGEVEVLVATDVAARGLDISEMPCVINFDLPYNAEDYVHRIGRTGRAGASGDAISLHTDKDERLLVDIEKLIKQKIVRLQLAGFVAVTPLHSEKRPRSAEFDKPREARESRESREGRDKSFERPTRGFQPAKEKIDPWFSKPYEPSTSAVSSKPVPGNLTGKPQKRAALLGGIKI
jgi:superfamily II DNA/RNA helicase